LMIGSNKLKELPKEIGNFKNLEYLNLMDSEELTTIPKELENLTKLETLQMNGPLSIHNYKVSYWCENLNLSHQELCQIPCDIYIRSYLKELDISFNRLTYITSFLARLKHLKKIDMRANALHTLPEFFWCMPELEEVMFDGYLFPSIPKGIRVDDSVCGPIIALLIAGKQGFPYTDQELKGYWGYGRIYLNNQSESEGKTVSFFR